MNGHWVAQVGHWAAERRLPQKRYPSPPAQDHQALSAAFRSARSNRPFGHTVLMIVSHFRVYSSENDSGTWLVLSRDGLGGARDDLVGGAAWLGSEREGAPGQGRARG